MRYIALVKYRKVKRRCLRGVSIWYRLHNQTSPTPCIFKVRKKYEIVKITFMVISYLLCYEYWPLFQHGLTISLLDLNTIVWKKTKTKPFINKWIIFTHFQIVFNMLDVKIVHVLIFIEVFHILFFCRLLWYVKI